MAVRTAMEHPIGALPRTPFPASRDFAPVGSMSLDFQVASLSYKSSSFATSRGNEGYGEKNRRVIYFTYHFGVFPLWWLSPPPCPVGSMSYDTESKSRNADFISIARRAIHNPYSATLLHNLPPSGGHNPRGEAPSTFPSEPSEPSRRRRVHVHVHVQEHNFSPIAFPKRGIIKKHITKNFRYENRSGMPGQLQGEIFC